MAICRRFQEQRSMILAPRSSILNNLDLRNRYARQRIAMLWWRNLDASSEGFVLKIERLTPVDCRETGVIRSLWFFFGPPHPQNLVRCEERSLHFVQSRRNLAPPTRVRTE